MNIKELEKELINKFGYGFKELSEKESQFEGGNSFIIISFHNNQSVEQKFLEGSKSNELFAHVEINDQMIEFWDDVDRERECFILNDERYYVINGDFENTMLTTHYGKGLIDFAKENQTKIEGEVIFTSNDDFDQDISIVINDDGTYEINGFINGDLSTIINLVMFNLQLLNHNIEFNIE